jgi:hypothetical protein
MSTHWLDKAVRTGREAAELGVPRSACPYDPRTVPPIARAAQKHRRLAWMRAYNSIKPHRTQRPSRRRRSR